MITVIRPENVTQLTILPEVDVDLTHDVIFVSEKGTQLGGIKELGEKSRGLLRNMDSVFKAKSSVTDELVRKAFILLVIRKNNS